MKRIVITGMGYIGPLGVGLTEYGVQLASLIRTSPTPITRFDTSGFDVKHAYQVPEFDPTLIGVSKRDVRRMDKFSLYSLMACDEALRNADLLEPRMVKERKKEVKKWFAKYPDSIAFIPGVGQGGLESVEKQLKIFFEKGARKVNPMLIPQEMPNAVAGEVSSRYEIYGETFSVNTACSSSLTAIAEACDKIKLGYYPIMISGGAEAPITQLGMSAFANMGAFAKGENPDIPPISRPYDQNRNGFVVGEGAAMLILEDLEYALKRKKDGDDVNIVGEIFGYGGSSDGKHITAPDEEGVGLAKAVNKALAMAYGNHKIEQKDIKYINSHGTSTPLNDKMEAKALRKVFGDHINDIFVNSTKSLQGHLLGATAAAEIVATFIQMNDGYLHTTANYDQPDPECNLNYVKGGPETLDFDYALKTSSGFGGHNWAIVVGKYKE
jgi:3-oxoacyl-[acyl-carrier-protein] synthase II